MFGMKEIDEEIPHAKYSQKDQEFYYSGFVFRWCFKTNLHFEGLERKMAHSRLQNIHSRL